MVGGRWSVTEIRNFFRSTNDEFCVRSRGSVVPDFSNHEMTRNTRKKMKEYRSALDRLRRGEDGYGRAIWIEKMGKDGKPFVFYRYETNGRLMKYTRGLYGYSVSPAEYARFGEQVDSGQ